MFSLMTQKILIKLLKPELLKTKNKFKISLLHIKSLRAQERKKSSIISKQSNHSIITFSNAKVKQNEENKRVLDTLIISTHELELDGEIFLIKL